jgi:MFS family permease
MATVVHSAPPTISRWWRIVGGLSMNLALGTLYAWSAFVAPLELRFGWKRTETSLAFTIAIAVFALGFILAGRLQDRYGPFWVSLLLVAGGGAAFWHDHITHEIPNAVPVAAKFVSAACVDRAKRSSPHSTSITATSFATRPARLDIPVFMGVSVVGSRADMVKRRRKAGRDWERAT